jgi:formylglycine-generating enzyme required for sulfatase activity
LKKPPRSGGLHSPTWHVSKSGVTFTVIAAPVEFLMGSPGHEPDRIAINERQHRKRIERSYALATRTITVRQWRQFLRANPEVQFSYQERYSPDADGPIVGVSWYDAASYCRWLSEKEGMAPEQMCYPSVAEIQKCRTSGAPLGLPPDYHTRTGYRLPTEAEWEYACRAGAIISRYYGSSEDLLPRYTLFHANSRDRAWPAGQKRPNDFGLFGMHGNVWCWCHDIPFLYRPGRKGKPARDVEDIRDIRDTQRRVLRGAAFSYRAPYVRAANRYNFRPDNRDVAFGLRVCRTYH